MSVSTVKSPTETMTFARIVFAIACIVTLVMYQYAIRWLVDSWWSSPDHSHGPLVVAFFVGYLWWDRKAVPSNIYAERDRGDLLVGCSLVVLGLVLRLAGLMMSILTIEAASLIPFLAGIAVIVFGRSVGRWAAPAIAFLVFMIPLPGMFMGPLSGMLQSISTQVSVFSLQLFGIPASAEGNVIQLSSQTIGVAQACSGLRMLYAFVAISVAGCLLTDRGYVEKAILLVSSVPIAIFANCVRITLTGLAYEYFNSDLASHIFHDFAGLLMFPIGIGLVKAELWAARFVFVAEEKAKQPAESR